MKVLFPTKYSGVRCLDIACATFHLGATCFGVDVSFYR